MEINHLVKKAFTTGLNLAVFTGEKVHSVMGTVIEKSKELQERFQEELEEEEEEMEEFEATHCEAHDEFEEECDDCESAKSESDKSTWQEYEQKMRNLVDIAVAKFNFIKRDDHKVIERRIDALEEKLDHITDLLSQQDIHADKETIISEKI